MCRKIRIRQKQSSIHLRRVFSVFKIGKRIICNIHSLTALNQEKTFVAVKQLQFRTSSSNSAIVRVHCEGSLWGFTVRVHGWQLSSSLPITRNSNLCYTATYLVCYCYKMNISCPKPVFVFLWNSSCCEVSCWRPWATAPKTRKTRPQRLHLAAARRKSCPCAGWGDVKCCGLFQRVWNLFFPDVFLHDNIYIYMIMCMYIN